MMVRSFFSTRSALALALASGLAVPGSVLHAQVVTGNTTQTTDAQGKPQTDVSLSVDTSKKKKKEKVAKEDRVQQTKATKKEIKKEDKFNPLIAKDAQLPDKQLYDKALAQEKSGHFDVARLDLETLLNTYPDSQYLMRAKLAVADCWYHEGGSAALAQAEQEYKDFITFFPNAPEAAEAQMRVGDIYFKQMDVPDRDYAKAISAETEYRTLLKQYPDAPPNILKQAKQKLREVQEMLAAREASIGAFYASHDNWAASIARYQTVVDTYPLYSHLDDVLIGIGDAYGAQAKNIRAQAVCGPNVVGPCLQEAVKSKLEQDFDSKSAAAYRTVVTKHAAAPHVEDAKERLQGMGLPIPQPTPEEAAASEALEGSRAQYTMQRRLELLIMRKPDTVTAAQIGDPPLEDPAATTAPMVSSELKDEFEAAIHPDAAPAAPRKPAAAGDTSSATAPAATTTPAAPLAFSDVTSAGGANTGGSTTEMAPASDAGTGTGTGVGATIISTGGGSAPPSNLPAATGKPDPNYGLTTAAPKDNTPLPAAEKPAEAPDQVNEAAGKQTLPAGTNKPTKNGKAQDYDKGDESSSQKKPKKGLDKLNPF